MLAPLPPNDWSLDHAAHLLNRAGFGGTPEQVRAFHSLGLDAAVGLLLSARDNRLAPPAWTNDPGSLRRQAMMMMPAGNSGDSGPDADRRREAIRDAMREEREHIVELRRWWLERMRSGGQPLVEKMTLFWHGHFATSVVKVRSAWAMWRQNQTLRENALGSFRSMLQAMARDPAMIRWLDLNRSKAGAPNENFARELMELFTLGIGHYTEDDIKQSARAFTGHTVSPATQEFFFARRAHDYGEKRFMGRSGRFDGDGIIDIILDQPQCARFIAGRLWEFFAYENPEPGLLDAAAFTLHGSNYQIAPLLGSMFRSSAFYSKRAVRTHIKSPVEWLVQTCVDLETGLPASPALDIALEQLGQALFQPPNVRGWEGGRSWISSSTLVLRYNLAGYLVGATDPAARRLFNRRLVAPVDIAKLAPASLREQPQALADALVFRLFGATRSALLRTRAMACVADAAQPISDTKARSIFQRLMSTPDYQLS
ncbi:MAG: DUF1800 domain-containing protein [Terrimicrobiaceae bacterium]|nr:DUF1800 domain-containing protein [Terrimicrobiaceae bacterium]